MSSPKVRETFEDLLVWQKAMSLVEVIYSIPANIAEGYEHATRKEYVHFLVIAKGSAGELRCLIRVAQRVQPLSKSKSQKIADQATEISRMLKGLIQSLKQSKH